jgi:hypothetical protein
LEKNQTSQRILLCIKTITKHRQFSCRGNFSQRISRAAATTDKAEQPQAEKGTTSFSSPQLFKVFHKFWQEGL